MADRTVSFLAGFLAGIGLALAVVALVMDLPKPATSPTYNSLKVVELRSMARQKLGPGAVINGRPVASARKADLVEVLYAV